MSERELERIFETEQDERVVAQAINKYLCEHRRQRKEVNI